MNEKEEIQTLKDWALSTFVQKDACSAHHEKTDEKINTLIVENTQTKVKLSIIQWGKSCGCWFEHSNKCCYDNRCNQERCRYNVVGW